MRLSTFLLIIGWIILFLAWELHDIGMHTAGTIMNAIAFIDFSVNLYVLYTDNDFEL